ncbi:MAG: hypothetical protein ACO1QB_15255 [Verrucomicrobiales bacterium]
MKAQGQFITLQEGGDAKAVVAPELGGWLLRYMRHLPGLGYVDVIHFDQEVVDRYPNQMYAGNPILFPLVSFNVVEGQEHFYQWPLKEGESSPTRFPMQQHGFGRKSPWKVAASTESMVRMELVDNEQTRAVYPFSFLHELQYELKQGRLHFTQKIVNRSGRVMPFSTGIHPYFQVPFTARGKRSSCSLRIPGSTKMIPQGNMENFAAEKIPPQELSINNDFSGTMFLADLEKREIELVDHDSRLVSTLNWVDAPAYRFVALWSKSTEEPFFCIEPWTALPNSFGRPDGELTLLQPGEEFRASIWIDFRSMV